VIQNVEEKVITFVLKNFTTFGGVKKLMSQFQHEPIHFPWIILVVGIVSLGFLFKIGQWGYEYVVWMWNNRTVKHSHHSSSKKKSKKTKKVSSSESESGSESSE
jgi:hypothetical protein